MTVYEPDTTMKYMGIQFKTCPFCGHDPVIEHELSTGDARTIFCHISVKCDDDNCRSARITEHFKFNNITGAPTDIIETVKKLAKRWNKRI